MDTSKSNHSILGVSTAISFAMAVLWLFIEFRLRESHEHIEVFFPVVAALGLFGIFFGLAIRARTTLSGESLVLGEILCVVLFAAASFPSLMLVLYTVITIISFLIVALQWLLFGMGVGLSWIFQVAFWAGGLAVGIVIIVLNDLEGGEIAAAIIIPILLWAAAVTGFGVLIGDTWSCGWDCSLPFWVFEFKDDIYDWFFAIKDFRREISGLDHGLLISTCITTFIGLGAAWISAFMVRRFRQLLMTKPNWRSYLPMAAAPVPDEVRLLSTRMVLPTVFHFVLGWSAIIYFLLK